MACVMAPATAAMVAAKRNSHGQGIFASPATAPTPDMRTAKRKTIATEWEEVHALAVVHHLNRPYLLSTMGRGYGPAEQRTCVAADPVLPLLVARPRRRPSPCSQGRKWR